MFCQYFLPFCGLSPYSLDPNPFLGLEDRVGKNWNRRQGGAGLSKWWTRPKLRAPVERSIKNMRNRDFPGGPVGKTPCSQPRGHGFSHWLGN